MSPMSSIHLHCDNDHNTSLSFFERDSSSPLRVLSDAIPMPCRCHSSSHIGKDLFGTVSSSLKKQTLSCRYKRDLEGREEVALKEVKKPFICRADRATELRIAWQFYCRTHCTGSKRRKSELVTRDHEVEVFISYDKSRRSHGYYLTTNPYIAKPRKRQSD